ncbi:MAG: tRNA (guanosine(37)-N1)-methyltransferase TrmD [Phycisphaerae bacterium]|nr:tRNA (guanosine(37)-N1)-methyltransferase TrmD [Phycisphaerae bacterium]
MALRFDILTLFPEMFEGFLDLSIIGRARAGGLIDVCLTNIRRFAKDKRGTVDDKPFGGGPGMVLMAEPIFDAVEAVKSLDKRAAEAILLTPQGEPFTQGMACELAACERLILVCGHYEGFDERIRTLADRQISIGPYVLTGGELPAMVVLDGVTRLLPGAIGAEEGTQEESFADGELLEYPQYTRPREFRGMNVPEVLLSGNHAEIQKWRRQQAEKRTQQHGGRKQNRAENPSDT